MTNLMIGNNAGTHRYIEKTDQTPRQLLEKYGIDYSGGATVYNGCTLTPAQMEMTLDELGVGESCSLLNMAKTN